MKNKLILIIALLMCVGCSSPEEPSAYMHTMLPNDYEVKPYKEEEVEILELPFELTALAVDEEGDPCWHYYYRHGDWPGSYVSGCLVYFSLFATDDSSPDFINYMVLVGGPYLAEDYKYNAMVWFDTPLLHLPTSKYKEGFGRYYEFTIPIVFNAWSEHGNFAMTFYHLTEEKWYRTKRYKVTLHEDLIEGDFPLLGGKVTMECLE